MNFKPTAINTPIVSTVLYKLKNFIRSREFVSVNQKKIEYLKNSILDLYSKESDHFVKTRRNHEKAIREQFTELRRNGATVADVLIPSEDAVIHINKSVEEIKEYVHVQNENEENDGQIIKEIKDNTEIMKALAVCGIRIEPKIPFYFLYRLLLYLKNNFGKDKHTIHLYDEVKEKQNYLRINYYYYHTDIYDFYMKIFKSLSNVLYTICESCVDTNETYIIIKKEIEDTYSNIDDVIRKAPSFLNISLLFFYINAWLFIDKSRKMKNTCLDYLNSYLSSISEDEINMSTDDLFYLFLTLRLFLYSFSYNEVFSNLNNFSKQFLSSVVFFPHNSESFVKNEKMNYSYIVDFLNKNEKYVEHKEVSIPPFHYPLTSLKNKTVYIAESKNDYYANESEIIRACNWWRYFIAKREGYQLLLLCKQNEFDDFLSEEKRDELMKKYIHIDYSYPLKEHNPL